MASLFQGSPQKATQYTTTTTETPQWMQDAVFNQLSWAQNLANMSMPDYALPRKADFSPLQTRAYQNVDANQGFWQGDVDRAQAGMYGFGTQNSADALNTAQNTYLNPLTAPASLTTGATNLSTAAGMNILGTGALGSGDARSYLTRAGLQDIPGAATNYLTSANREIGNAASGSAMTAANPYLTAAALSGATGVTPYMSPYQSGVMDVLAKQGARQLNEQFLPAVSEQFIKAGQFGSSRMGEFGSRALRDMQEGVLNKQGDLLNQGYNQALVASQGDLNRQAQLASTAGSTSAADLSRILQAASQYGSLGQTAGGLTGQQMQYLANLGHTTGQLTGQQMQQLGTLGQMQTTAGQAQQQFGLGAAQQTQTARAQDYTRQMAALNQFQQMQAAEQGMRGADVAALETAGQAQQGQNQRGLDQAYQEFVEQQMYPRQQMDWLSTQVRGLSPITPQTVSQQGQSIGASYSPSPLSQLASGVFAGKGLQSLWG